MYVCVCVYVRMCMYGMRNVRFVLSDCCMLVDTVCGRR